MSVHVCVRMCVFVHVCVCGGEAWLSDGGDSDDRYGVGSDSVVGTEEDVEEEKEE